MSDQNATAESEGAGTPAPVIETSQADDKKPATVENPGEATAPDTGQAPEGSERPQKRNGYQKRIDELVREREAWRQIAERAIPDPTQAKRAEALPVNGEPRIEDFTDYEEYVAAKAEFRVERRLADKQARETERQKAESRQKAFGSFEAKVTQLADRIPDLEEAVEAAFKGEIPVTEAMAEAIVEVSDRGPELLRYLVKNPEEADRIARMSPAAAGIAIARLEQKLPSLEPKKATSAPPPVSKVAGASDAGKKAPQEMSMAEYAAWYKSRK